jgi:hypothetical protein
MTEWIPVEKIEEYSINRLIAGGWLNEEYRGGMDLIPQYWKWGLFELKETACADGHEDWLHFAVGDDAGFRFNDDYPTGGDSVYVWDDTREYYPMATTCLVCESENVTHPLEVRGDLTLESQCCTTCWEAVRWPEKWHPQFNHVGPWWDRVYRRKVWAAEWRKQRGLEGG